LEDAIAKGYHCRGKKIGIGKGKTHDSNSHDVLIRQGAVFVHQSGHEINKLPLSFPFPLSSAILLNNWQQKTLLMRFQAL